jgi:O-antigen/teichoic acid export membrane protein
LAATDVISDPGAVALKRAKARLARGASNAFMINAFGTGLAFLSQIVLARVLGADGYGIYAYVVAWVMVLAVPATLGFQTGLLRFASAYRAREEWPLLGGILRYATRRVSLAGLMIGLVTAGVLVALHNRLAPELVRTFLVGCAIVPLQALLQLLGSVARAFGGVASALVPQNLLSRAVVLVVVGMWALFVSWPIEPHTAMIVMLLGTALALATVIWGVSRLRPASLATASIAYEAQEWRRAALALLFIGTVRVLLGRSDLLMLGMLADTTSVGIYAVASRIAELVAFALTAINVIFAPHIAALHARGDRTGLQAMVTTTARWAALSAVLIGLPLFVLAGTVLSLFGDAFTSGEVVLRILLVGQIFNAAAGSVGQVLVMTGHERQAAAVVAIAAVAQIGLNAVMIPLFGPEGAAVTRMLTVIGWNLAMVILVWRMLKIVPSILAR